MRGDIPKIYFQMREVKYTQLEMFHDWIRALLKGLLFCLVLTVELKKKDSYDNEKN